MSDAGKKAELADAKVRFYWLQIRFFHYKFIFDLMLFNLVHGDSEHFADAFAVEYLESRELETGKGPGKIMLSIIYSSTAKNQSIPIALVFCCT